MRSTVLVVDDDPSFLDSVSLVLDLDFQVFRASSLRECKNILSRRSVQVVVSDFRMTLGNGHEVAELTRTYNSRTPVILVTAYADKEMAIRSANLHVYALLEKPISLTDLKRIVKEAVAFMGTPALAEKANSGDLILNEDELSVSHSESVYRLTETEFKILRCLMLNSGRRVSRNQLADVIWGASKTSYNLLDTHLLNLRKKLPLLKSRLRVIRGSGLIYCPTQESAVSGSPMMHKGDRRA